MDTIVYLNGMPYLAVLPSLICGLVISISDLRTRRIPRIWVLVGSVVQCAVFIALGVRTGSPWMFAAPLIYAATCAALQWCLARMRPGTLGLGDITATFMMAQAIGAFGFTSVCIWWLFMGLLGLIWIGLWHVTRRFVSRGAALRPAGTPFVPVIVMSAVFSVMLA